VTRVVVCGLTPRDTSLAGQERRDERRAGLLELVRERGYVDQVDADADDRHWHDVPK
jgi:hypothetical protein